jgi:hypothetical protein
MTPPPKKLPEPAAPLRPSFSAGNQFHCLAQAIADSVPNIAFPGPQCDHLLVSLPDRVLFAVQAARA